MTTQTFLVSRSGQIATLHAYLDQEVAKGRVLRVTVSNAPSRSQEQNAFLHLAIRDLARHVGQSETELKEFLKAEYGPTDPIQVGRTTALVPRSMSRYSREDAAAMIEHVLRLAAECGLLIEPRGLL